MLAGLGGLVGVCCGLLGSFGAASALSLPFVVSSSAIAVAFGVSVSAGVSFGVFRARKASRLRPIDALRFE